MNDDHILLALRDLFEATDPVPPDLRRRVLDHFDLLHMDVLLAKMVFDSAQAGALVGVRSTATMRQVAFESENAALELTIDGIAAADGTIRLIGQLIPGTEESVVVTQEGQRFETRTDALGRFQVDGLTRDPLRIEIGTLLATAPFTP